MNMPVFSLAILMERKTGKEKFLNNSHFSDLCLQHFWQWACSDILSNAVRGKLAEFIVASALDIHQGICSEWESYDLITKSGRRLEIKSSGYIQSWHQKSKSKIIFGIQPTRKWDDRTGLYEEKSRRQSDVYVFCLLAHQNPETINPMDLQQWEFHILPTSMLNKHKEYQKTISLGSLKKLNPSRVEYSQLAEIIENIDI